MASLSINHRPTLGVAFVALATMSVGQYTFTSPRPTRPENRSEIAVSLFPLGSFNIGGSFGAQGGNDTRTGLILAASQVWYDKNRDRRSLGLFSFVPIEGSDEGRLYGIEFGQNWEPGYGFHVAYYNLFGGGGDSAGIHATYIFQEQGGTGLSATVGVGTHIDFSRQLVASPATPVNPNPTLQRRAKTTLGYSIFASLEFPLAPNFSINLNQWVFRSRASDLTRLAIGATYRF